MAVIMLVDDEPSMLSILKDLVSKDGHQILLAQDGLEASQLFKQKVPDLVITDILMPNKEGLEFISEIRAAHPNIKIIAYTGGGSSDPQNFLEFAKGMGADKVFSKPVPLAKLREEITQLLT